MEAGRIAFVDIDGTLTTCTTRFLRADAACVATLNRITDATGAAIVVTSSRRSSVEGARILLSGWGISGHVMDITPRCGGGRAAEIQAWLHLHLTGAFVILDDAVIEGPLAAHAIRVNPTTGLTGADAERVIAFLNAQR